MANNFKLNILTPEKQIYSGDVAELITTSIDGTIAILANHIPLLTTLKPTVTEIIDASGKKLKIFSSSGILEMKDNEAKILCDSCEWPEEIDFNRVEDAKKRAEERLNQKDGVDIKRAELALARAISRMKLK